MAHNLKAAHSGWFLVCFPSWDRSRQARSPSLISDHEMDPELHDNNINKNAQSHHIAVFEGGGEEDGTAVPIRGHEPWVRGTVCQGTLPSHLQPVPLTKGEEICVLLLRLRMHGGRLGDHLGVPASPVGLTPLSLGIHLTASKMGLWALDSHSPGFGSQLPPGRPWASLSSSHP